MGHSRSCHLVYNLVFLRKSLRKICCICSCMGQSFCLADQKCAVARRQSLVGTNYLESQVKWQIRRAQRSS